MKTTQHLKSTILALAAFVLPLAAEPMRVSEQDAQKSVVQRIKPDYPAIAKQLKLSGQVVVDMTVAENGSVESADIVAGNPILGNAAKLAAKGWKFQPFQADGKASKAVVRVSFNFHD